MGSLRCNWRIKKGWRTLSAGFSHYLQGKFLFFGPDWEALAHLAEEEMLTHGMALATIPMKPRDGSYVLCLFDVDPKRDQALRQRFLDDYEDGEIVYRGWKGSKGSTWQRVTITPEQFKEAQEAARAARPDLSERGFFGRGYASSTPGKFVGGRLTRFVDEEEALFGPGAPNPLAELEALDRMFR